LPESNVTPDALTGCEVDRIGQFRFNCETIVIQIARPLLLSRCDQIGNLLSRGQYRLTSRTRGGQRHCDQSGHQNEANDGVALEPAVKRPSIIRRKRFVLPKDSSLAAHDPPIHDPCQMNRTYPLARRMTVMGITQRSGEVRNCLMTGTMTPPITLAVAGIPICALNSAGPDRCNRNSRRNNGIGTRRTCRQSQDMSAIEGSPAVLSGCRDFSVCPFYEGPGPSVVIASGNRRPRNTAAAGSYWRLRFTSIPMASGLHCRLRHAKHCSVGLR
jgi:hypothetical protein